MEIETNWREITVYNDDCPGVTATEFMEIVNVLKGNIQIKIIEDTDGYTKFEILKVD